MIRTVLVFLYVFVTVILLLPIGIVAMLLSFFGLAKLMAKLVYRLGQGWALVIIKITGCTVTVTGRENIPMSDGVCFVSNHCGIFDIILLLAYCGRPIGFVAKKELLLLPVFNVWIFLIGGLFIDRKNVGKALRTISKGVAKIKSGGGMIIFPEGHRSRGQGLLPFHPGSLKLATQAQAPIVPVSIAGTYEVIEKNNRITPAPLMISFSEPIHTKDLPPEDRKIVLCNRVYEIIKGQLSSSP